MADRSKKKELKKGKDKKQGSATKLGLVFGRRLEEVIEMQNNGNYVPNIVRDTITWLEANGGSPLPSHSSNLFCSSPDLKPCSGGRQRPC
jgi:hypothetical protein